MREGCYGSLRAEFEYQMQQWVAVLTRTPDGSQDHPDLYGSWPVALILVISLHPVDAVVCHKLQCVACEMLKGFQRSNSAIQHAVLAQ